MMPFTMSFLMEDLNGVFSFSIIGESKGGSPDFQGFFYGSIEEYRRMFLGFKTM